VEIKPFKTINGNGYSFREIWKIYDEQFNILRDIILSLGDKYQVENFSGSDNKVITLNTPYNSNQVFVYCNGVLQWKDRDYRENSPTEIELLFDRKATDDVRVVTIKSNVIKNDLHQYLQDISSVVANAKEQYDSARNLESRLVELYSSLQQTHSLYTNNSTASLVTDLTRLKSEYEKVNTSVTALDKKLKDLIGSSEYILTTLNIDELKELVKSIKAQIDEVSSEKSLDVVYPMFGAKQSGDDASTFDVGDCIFVGIDKKYWFMVDTFSKSTGDGGYNSIKRSMGENGITKFEFLLITHWHKDHYGNAIRLMNEGLVGKVYVQDVTKYPNGITGAYGMTRDALKYAYDEHKNVATTRNIPFSSAPTGEVDFHGAKLLFHNNDTTAIAKHNSSWVNENYNNTSICLLVSYIGRNFLTQGDADKEVMREYIDILPSNIDLLKSNHHSIASMPLSFRKLRPRDAVITANQWQLALCTKFNYQAYLFDMGSNVYFLANQKEDIHISYSSLSDNISYNKKLEVGYPDNCAYLTAESGGHIFVDASYSGNDSTGDKDKPFKYLTDAVRYAHITSMGEIRVNIAPGDYTRDVRNYNFLSPASGTSTILSLAGLRGKVWFVNTGNSEAILPPTYVTMCDNVTFNNITFSIGDNLYTNDVVSKLSYSFNSVGISDATVMFKGCKFLITNSAIADKSNTSTFKTIHIDAFRSIVTVDTCTFKGNAQYGIRSCEGSTVTVVGSNTVDNLVGIMYYATEGDINVNGAATKNTSSETTGGGQVRFQDVATTPTYPNTTRGQVIGTQLATKYGGKLGYISDGTGGYASIDHFNRSGNLDNKPDFEGQFAYDKTNKRLGFALGSSNKSDWLDLSSNNGIGGVKEWKQGGTYSYGDLISNSQGNLFYYRGGDISYRSGTSVDTKVSGDLRVIESLGERFVNIDPNNHAHTSFAMLHNKPENFPLPTTNSEINKLGMFITYYTKYVFSGQPTKYGQLINIPPGIDDTEEAMQIWVEQNSGQMYVRGGNWQNSVASRNFEPVYPDNFDTVDYLFKGVVSTVSDARSRNLRLARSIDSYKVVTFYLTPDNNNDFCVSCSFEVSDFKNMLNTLKKSGVPTNCYLLNKHQLWWGLKLNEGTLSSTSIADITWDENCKLVGVTGWPRKFNLD
jgi:beta-lactamase superfamily II metal-dependent hydrolase